MLDQLPSWARHLLIVFGSTFLAGLAATIVGAGGVTDVDWPTQALAAFNAAAVATATAAGALWLTPLTRKYGVGSSEGA